jgi:hypothetical protein
MSSEDSGVKAVICLVMLAVLFAPMSIHPCDLLAFGGSCSSDFEHSAVEVHPDSQ